MNAVTFFILIYMINNVKCYEECSYLKTECKYWLTVEEKLTMTWKKTRVRAVNQMLYKYDESPENYTIKIPIDEVITADGFERVVLAVNNTVPGPPIIVYEGQLLIIQVTNNLLSDSITIHWHGLHQVGTPFMDGVAYITQCPIAAGQTFTYRFYAKPKGTFWYHSHIGGQRVDGLFGAVIIKEKISRDTEDMIMFVGDWFHALGSQLHTMMISGYFKSQPNFKQQKTLDGVYYAPAIFQSALIEGKGQYYNPSSEKWNETPLKEYFVKSGLKYRFRVICHGVIYPFRISVDNHTLTVISSDGYDVKPREFESLIINPGDMYDFLITANQIISSYWIRADSLELVNIILNFPKKMVNAQKFHAYKAQQEQTIGDLKLLNEKLTTDSVNLTKKVGNPNHYVRAILRYTNSTEMPKTNRSLCTVENQCVVLNCPYKYYPQNDYTLCVKIDELENLIDESPPKFEKDSIEEFMNFVQDTNQMNVNGRHFVHPGFNSLELSEEVDEFIDCKKKNCSGFEICYCYNELTIPYDKTIQMVWSNHPYGSTRHHPIHLHGHSFYVLKMDYGIYNETNGIKISNNLNINCTGETFCVQPTWRNNSWKNGNVPGLNLKNPPIKDTLIVPAGAYAVIRFRSNNPGKWFLHCHVEFHAMQGMAMVVNEAQDKQAPLPEGFPVCKNFMNNFMDSRDKLSVKNVLLDKKEPRILSDTVIGLGVLSCVFFVLLIALICFIIRVRRKSVIKPMEVNEMKKMTEDVKA
ncbi:LOW QUALITY PROTEIN: uncharacterized protein LOC100210525 isoform X1 [Hydra vulgaris]|uniref:LOW QUALITY PROTEIN: uncharacterized protein LOC100210525 isoform X1 n=1 Tax=Hydra vulgaris TaxID=6087 RepID=UPI0032E9C79A